MKAGRFAGVVAALGFLGTLMVPHAANAAEIRVLCSIALKAVAEELFPQFEKSTNHRVSVQFALAATQKQKAESGERLI